MCIRDSDNGVWKTWTPSTQPAKDVTVYAEYDVPAQAEYVINYWYQNNTDEVDTPDDQKTYTLFDHETKTQNVNTPVVYNGATPVSYTHLDVYKRQSKSNCKSYQYHTNCETSKPLQSWVVS